MVQNNNSTSQPNDSGLHPIIGNTSPGLMDSLHPSLGMVIQGEPVYLQAFPLCHLISLWHTLADVLLDSSLALTEHLFWVENAPRALQYYFTKTPLPQEVGVPDTFCLSFRANFHSFCVLGDWPVGIPEWRVNSMPSGRGWPMGSPVEMVKEGDYQGQGIRRLALPHCSSRERPSQELVFGLC